MIQAKQPAPTFINTDLSTRLWAIARHHLLFISWALMEVALIVPLAYALMPWLTIYHPAVVTCNLLVVVVLPHYLSTFLTWLNLSAGTQKRVLMLTAFLLIVGTIQTALYDLDSIFDFSWLGQLFRNMTQANNNLWHRDFGLFILIAVCWWRGMLLINRIIDVARFGEHFRRGGLVVAPIVLILANFRLEWSVLPFLLLFLFVGLTAVTLTRIEQAERDQSAILKSVNLRWFVTVIGFGSLILLAATLFSALLTGQSGDSLGAFFTPIWLGFQFVASAIIFTITFLLSPLLPLVERVTNQLLVWIRQVFFWVFSEIEVPEEDNPATGPETVQELLNERLLEVQQDGFTALLNWKLVLAFVLTLTVIMVIILLVRNYRMNKAVVKDGRFNKSVGGLLGRLNPTRRQRSKASKTYQQLDWRAAITIQRIYEQMVYLAQKEGYGREKNQTPYEYLTRLHTLWPDHKPHTNLITQAFVKIRYGELPQSQEEFNQIQQAWEQINQIELSS